MPIGKLGRIKPAVTPYKSRRCLNLEDYFTAQLRPPPASADWSHSPLTYGVMLNDQEGDCAIATPCHEILLWSAYTLAQAIVVPDSTVQQVYSAISGYDPTKTNPITGENPTDTGCVMGDVFTWWIKNGIMGHRPAAAVALNTANITHIKWAVDIFGSVPIGVTLPQSAMDETNAGKPWTVVPLSPILGGHAIPIVGYDSNYVTVITWGQKQLVTWQFLEKHMDEAWSVIDPLWVDSQTGNSPVGLNITSMLRDASLL